jgi:hypothetical protein
MKRFTLPSFLAGAVIASLLVSALSAGFAQESGDPPVDSGDMAAMMAKAQKYTNPGEHHELLNRFLGEWDAGMTVFMGGKAMGPTKGTSKFEWLMEDRWLKSDYQGSMMGMPMRIVSIMGYDNFKQSYVVTSVNSMDTIMIHQEGDMDPGGKALLMYGTLDEYLTGEHDKMVKSVFRFLSEDEFVMEVHDLPIGEKNTKVFEIRYTRRE